MCCKVMLFECVQKCICIYPSSISLQCVNQPAKITPLEAIAQAAHVVSTPYNHSLHSCQL